MKYARYTLEGIILKRRNTGETDKIFTVFTKQIGKIQAIAKGVRKISSRRSGHLEVFNRLRLTLSNTKGMENIIEAELVEGFNEIGKDLAKTGYAYYLVEIVNELVPEREKHENIFELLNIALNNISSSKDQRKRNSISYSFALNLLNILGYVGVNQKIPKSQLTTYIESITEKRLKAPKIVKHFL
jgi:DNA repair protein RecO (recombination protein O)